MDGRSESAAGGAGRAFVAGHHLLASGEMTPRALLEACLETVERREPSLHAFAALDVEAARAAADASTQRWSRGAPLSELDGCPVGVKDIIATRGLATQMNSPLYRGWQAPAEATCVAALRAGGAVVVGKTHTTEFAVGVSPPTTNPWDPGRTPGGSSSGSAAAVGAGMLPLALGTQTVGSILRPASFCGAVGYKPGHGTLPLGGVHPLARTLDHLGPIAASVPDAWAAVRVIQRAFGAEVPDAMLEGTPLGPARAPARLVRVRVEGEREVEPAACEAFDRFVEALRRRGVTVVEAGDEPAVQALEDALEEANALCTTILRYEMRWPFEEYAARGDGALGAPIRAHLEAAAGIDEGGYRAALSARADLREQVRRVANGCDGFILPAASGVAPPGLAFTGPRTMLAPWSLIGGPAWSLPLLAVDGLPLGAQLAGAPGTDAALAPVARWLMDEQEAPS